MNTEQMLTSLEISKRIAEAGFKGESQFYWLFEESGPYKDQWTLCKRRDENIPPKKRKNGLINCYFTDELLAALPRYTTLEKHTVGYAVEYSNDRQHFCLRWADTPANALGEVLIELIKKGVVK